MATEQANGVVACVAYAEGKRLGDISIPDISEALKKPGVFVWIGLHDPDPELLKQIQHEFGLHDLAVEDAQLAHQRPKLEQYGDSIFVVLRPAILSADKQHVELGETHLFVGPRYIVSIRHGNTPSYAAVRSRCESTPPALAKGPGYVLYALMDFIVDQYFPVLDTLSDQLERLEDEIFSDEFDRATVHQIYDLKRNLVEVKRAVSPLVDVCNRLVRFDMPLIPEDTRPYFRDVYDHAIRINEQVDTLRELLTSALEAHLSLTAVRAERRHEEARGVGGHHRGAHHGGRRVRDELQVHAGARVALRLSGGADGHGRDLCLPLLPLQALGLALT